MKDGKLAVAVRRWILILGAFVAAHVSVEVHAAGVMYQFTAMQKPGWRQSYVYGINNNGQIVGSYSAGNDFWPTFLYSAGNFAELGDMGMCQNINDNGQIVGSYGDFFDGMERPFVYGSGHFTDLGFYGSAGDINAKGQIVGSRSLVSDDRAFLYSSGTVTDLGTLPGWANSSASSINSSGQIVGWAYNWGAPTTGHAFLYDNGSMKDLGTLGGTTSHAYCISENGLIVGASDTPGNSARHAVLWNHGAMVDLGTLGGTRSFASDINASGQIVGQSTNHAFLYDNGTMKDLNSLVALSPGWVLRNAVGINDSGWIIGYGAYNNTDIAFLLTPIPETVHHHLACCRSHSRVGVVEKAEGLIADKITIHLPLNQEAASSSPRA